MTTSFKLRLLIVIFTCVTTIEVIAQQNIKYGSDYVVFEAEDTNTSLGNLWKVRTPNDPDYLKYLTNIGNSPDPINNNYLEYVGPWQGAGSDLVYKFTAPKTGAYRMAMRMHCPLRSGEKDDQRNDVFVKLEGNYTSGNTGISENRARTLTKLYGRGPNKWGTCLTLEFEHKHQRPIYNLIEGEEYTFTMKGRSTGASYDYIAFYIDNKWLDQHVDLALQIPTEIRPYTNITGISILNPTPGEIRDGTSLQLETAATPSNADASATWSSSDDAIISVDTNGKITAHGSIGQKATITATSTVNSSLNNTQEITIVEFYEVPVSSVKISANKTDLIVGENLTLTSEVLPVTTHDPSLTWSSSDNTIATITNEGVVSFIKDGSVTIRATSNQNNTLYDEITFNVVPFAEISVAFDDDAKYKNGTFYNQNHMEVTFNYHAGALKTINKPVKLYLREINGSWGVEKDVVIDVTEPVGKTSGSATANIPLDGLTPSASLTSGHFYFLFVVIENSDAVKANKGLNPIIILDKSLSTEEQLLKDSIRLYPNPASSFINIQKDDAYDSLQFDIYNLSGKKVLSDNINSNSKKISTHNLSSGIYLMRIKSDTAITTKKLIIK